MTPVRIAAVATTTHHRAALGRVKAEKTEAPSDRLTSDERPERAMIFAQELEDLLGLGGLGKGGVAAQVTEHDDDLAAMAFEDFLVPV